MNDECEIVRELRVKNFGDWNTLIGNYIFSAIKTKFTPEKSNSGYSSQHLGLSPKNIRVDYCIGGYVPFYDAPRTKYNHIVTMGDNGKLYNKKIKRKGRILCPHYTYVLSDYSFETACEKAISKYRDKKNLVVEISIGIIYPDCDKLKGGLFLTYLENE